MRKFIFLFLLSINAIFAVNLPNVISNETMMSLIEDNIRKMSDGSFLFQINRDVQTIGINLSDIKNIDSLLLESMSHALSQGIPLDGFIAESKRENIYFPSISVDQIDGYKGLLQKGFESALSKGEVDDCLKFIAQAKQYGVSLDLSKEKLQKFIQEAIADIFIQDKYHKKQYFFNLMDFAKSFVLDLSSIEIEKGVEKGLDYCMKMQDKLEKLNSQIVSNNYGLKTFKKLAAWCEEKGIAFELSKIPNVSEYVAKNIKNFLSQSDLAYLKEHGIEIQWKSISNLKEVLEDALVEFSCKKGPLACSYLSNEITEDSYGDYLAFLNEIAEENNVFIDQGVVSEKSKNQIQKNIKKAVSQYSRFWTSKNVSDCISEAKSRNIEISLNHIPEIEKSFKKGVFEILSIKNNLADFIDIIQFAQSHELSVSISSLKELVYQKLRKEMARTDIFAVKRIIKELKTINIELDITKIPGLDDAIMDGLVHGIQCNNEGLIEDFLEALKEAGVNPSLKNGYQESLFRAIAKASIHNIIDFVEFTNEMGVDIQLKDVPNIEAAFYKGCEKALYHRSKFIYEYLLQLARENDIELDFQRIDDLYNKLVMERKLPLREDFLLGLYPERILDLLDLE